MNKPSIGRIVHYVLGNRAHRPAIICHVDDDGLIDIKVFVLSRDNAGFRDNEVLEVLNVRLDDRETPDCFTWHWPERV